MEMGVVPGVEVRVIKTAPFGDPIEVRLRGYSLAMRRRRRMRSRSSFEAAGTGQSMNQSVHTSSLTIALAGNPNAGKTTLFNALTGLKQEKIANLSRRNGYRAKRGRGAWVVRRRI